MSGLVHVRGLAELQKVLDSVSPKLERNVMRGGLRAGANVILTGARSNIRSRSGKLAASLGVGTKARGGRVSASVRTRLFYAPFVEFGTRPHSIAANNRKGLAVGGLFFHSVDHPGARPHPFLRPAMDTQAGAAVVAVGEYVKQRLATKEGLDTAHIQIQGDE